MVRSWQARARSAVPMTDYAESPAMWLELVTPKPGVVVLQLEDTGHGCLPVARACADGARWRVRALLCGHEEVVPAAQVHQTLLEDFHEVFPGVELVPHVLKEAA